MYISSGFSQRTLPAVPLRWPIASHQDRPVRRLLWAPWGRNAELCVSTASWPGGRLARAHVHAYCRAKLRSGISPQVNWPERTERARSESNQGIKDQTENTVGVGPHCVSP